MVSSGWSRWVLTLALVSVGCGAPATVTSDPPPRACEDGDVDQQRYGTDCICCHTREFGIAGSIDRAGGAVSEILVEDSVGRRSIVSPNPYGNFFRHLQMTPPLRASIVGTDGRIRTMIAAAPYGGCNSCHRPSGPAPRLRAP